MGEEQAKLGEKKSGYKTAGDCSCKWNNWNRGMNRWYVSLVVGGVGVCKKKKKRVGRE